ncbi:MAG TPA: glycerol-3-phosphate dehydrogenase/oxidase [Actinomycetota bacterium]|nr:glycerol-3-phosphate dehydrogenase/oxidase [Actinomycetota bacterium]
MSGLGRRDHALEKLAATDGVDPLDLLVVGGGITGAGIALDAAARGMMVGLVERLDFGSGTSSKSSKLIHGGLRYLEQREFALMREACTERDLLRRLAPHLVEAVPMALPVSDRKRRVQFGVGLWAYDALASFKNMKIHRHLNGTETEALVPALPPGKVRGGFLFYDAKTDDVRLVMANLVEAVNYGAIVVNHAIVRDLTGGRRSCAAQIEDSLTGSVFDVRARRIVVAAGVWADRVEALAKEGSAPRLRPSKGIHLVFRRDAIDVGETAAFIPDIERRRMLFVIPWLGEVLVGTTDVDYAGPLDHPDVTASERDYILDSLNAVFELDLDADDVAGAYAGLRPLIQGKAGSTADLSRRHAVYDIAEGIVGITGGKMTTYRRMAKDATDRVASELGNSARSKTRWIKLGCADLEGLRAAAAQRLRTLGLDDSTGRHLIRAYGDRALDVLDIAAAEGLTAPLAPGYAPITAEAVYCARHEMAVHLNDLLARRTRLALLDRNAGIGESAHGADLMGREHGWRRSHRKLEVEAHRLEVERERGLAIAPPVVRRRGFPLNVSLRERRNTG